MRYDWKRRLVQYLFAGAMAMNTSDAVFDAPGKNVNPDEILAKMTLREKILMLGGSEDLSVHGIPRLNVPSVWMSDAVSGIRCFGKATSFPAGIILAASWDRDLIYKAGAAVADECRARGVSVILGPGVNIARVPVCGRNFEYFGEDPFLSGDMAAAYIRGVQDHGVMAVVKHYACNNSEYDRHKSNSVVDNRTLHEIYLPAFEHAVIRGKVMGVMTAYNQVNGIYAGEHPVLLEEILRIRWGFRGITMSDWKSLYTSEGSVKNGVDLEMPKARKMSVRAVAKLLRSGRAATAMIDRKVARILETFSKAGFYTRQAKDPRGDLLQNAGISIARRSAEEGIVLLNNEDTLPLPKGRRVVVLGRCACNTPAGGGGSSYVPAEDSPDITEALREEGLEIIDAPSDDDVRSADHVIIATGFDRFYESEAYDRPYALPDGEDELILRVSRMNNSVIVVLHAGGDLDISLWINHVQAALFAGYLGMNRGTAPARIITGQMNPSGKLPFTMAMDLNDHPGMKGYPKNPWDISFLRILGPQGNPYIRKVRPVRYSEGLLVGYRYFDTQGIAPRFPFGHGLSYTTFDISNVETDTAEILIGEAGLSDPPVAQVKCTITNTGKLPGAEVIQVYVHDEQDFVQRPDQELKGFEKCFLNPGESRQISIPLNSRAFMHYDSKSGSWIVNRGTYEIRIGRSSRDIQGRVQVSIKTLHSY